MQFREIEFKADDGVATLRLNRPERLNAWTPLMESEVREAMTVAAADSAVRAIILTGNGRGFCAGLDMDQLAQKSSVVPQSAPSAPDTDFSGRFTYFPSIGKPVIAAINGPVAGSGLALTLGCDLRFAAESAVFTTSFARRGLTAEHGTSWLLPRLVGMANAADLLLSGRCVHALEALEMGLVNKVVPDANLLTYAQTYAASLAHSCSLRSMRIIKRQIWDALSQTLGEAVSAANREMESSFSTSDFKEGVRCLREKTVPHFTET